ncbi:acyl carrier protein [Streptomyces monticola]|uniref:Acyl carrier protein n=1 Tax=Streptomyces monticola TaxID=2666263 RepID=A0ABW2JB62_9ACTN
MTTHQDVRAAPAPRPAPDSESAVFHETVRMLADVLAEYAIDTEAVTMDTRLGDDLELESIDLVTLAGQLEERYGERVNFAAFLAELDIDEIIALTVGRLVRHVVHALRGDAPEPGE